MRSTLRALAIIVCTLLAACTGPTPPDAMLSPDPVVIAVAGFNQPFHEEQLMAGYIPDDQGIADPAVLQQLDAKYRSMLSETGRDYRFLPSSALDVTIRKDSKGRNNVLTTWALISRENHADFIIVPQVMNWHERQGDYADVRVAPNVVIDFYLIDARAEHEDGLLAARSHYSENPQILPDYTGRPNKIPARARLTASDFAEEAMRSSLYDFKL